MVDFVDIAERLTTEEFAIDRTSFAIATVNGHVLCTDFLDHSHIGTGTVVDRILTLHAGKQAGPGNKGTI